LRDFVGALKSRWQITPARIVGLDLVRSPDDLFPKSPTALNSSSTIPMAIRCHLTAGSFDFLCCNHVLEHVFETEKLVREFRRCSHPMACA
jgi:2-polyprenyl-3-methyl-5-hydroxy-6-metoxy-1,4-benzoquinol methylase